jgi:hypothetical protein
MTHLLKCRFKSDLSIWLHGRSSQMLNKSRHSFISFYRTRRFFTVFTKARHWTLTLGCLNFIHKSTPILKVNHSRYTPWMRLGEISALDMGEWSASRPGRASPTGKGPPVPIQQESGKAPEPVWTQRLEEKSFRLCWGSTLDCTVVQSIVRHYTDWATRLPRPF